MAIAPATPIPSLPRSRHVGSDEELGCYSQDAYASAATPRSMYGEHAIGLLKLKKRPRPDRRLANDFFERAFGDLSDEVYAGAHGEDTSA
jgi:hypothetical protein